MRLASIALALCAIAGCGETHSSADAARPTPPTPIDVTGTWRTCALTLTLGDDGSLAFLDEARGCTARGDYTLDARTLELRWDAASECETLAGATQIREAVLGAGGMVLVDPSSGSTQRFAAEGTPVETWSAEGIESGTPELTRRSVLRVIGALGEGFGQGCYWSADDECGGLFSCGGSIVEWRREERSLVVRTACAGECPCNATIEGALEEDGAVDATYRAANCGRSFDGTLTLVPVAP